jgi:outer membrane PBP1 activator LpoA protein
VGHSVDLEAEPRPVRQPPRALPSPGASSAAEGSAKPLVDAIRALRSDHAPARALALLDAHQAELSRGSFNHEALLVRVEALLALHQEPEALRLLDATTLAHVAAWRSLRLTRAELRASAGRCTAALEDFDLVLAGAVDERAMRGRDLCRKKLAEQEHTRSAAP